MPAPTPKSPDGPPPRPKAVLFDIGGVCVVSPFRAILDYELSLAIPPGYVNYALSRTKPDGAWQRLERGEVPLDAAWFGSFTADLRRADLWAEWVARTRSRSRSHEQEAPPAVPRIDGEWMYWEMMRVSREPDPWMFPAVRRLKASGNFLIGALSNTSKFPEGHEYNAPVADEEKDVKAVFDVFVSSAHVGLRKPDRPIYELAMHWLNEKWREEWAGKTGQPGELLPGDVLFLDDIGENLKTAKQLGMRTLKVNLGKTRDAVAELERLTGTTLLDAGGEAKL